MTSVSGIDVAVLAQHAAVILAAAALLALWIAIGIRLLSGLGFDTSAWPEPLPLVTAALLGQGVVACLMLGLGSLGLLRAPWVLIVLLSVALVVRTELHALGRAAWGCRTALSTLNGALPRIVLAAWLGVLALALAFALAPPWEWDTLTYHLAIPEAFLRTGWIHVPEDNLHASFIGIAQLATLPMLAMGFPAGPAVANAVIFALLVAATAALARVVGEPEDAWWTLCLLLGTPALLLVATTGRIDATVTFALVVAHALLLRALERRDTALLALACGCLGIAAGMKLLALAYVAGCVPFVLLRFRKPRPLAAAVLAFGVTLAPWLVKNIVLFGAPLFPLGAPWTFEPWLARIAGSTAMPPGIDPGSLLQLEESREAFNLLDAFLHPEHLSIEGEAVFYRLPWALALLPLVTLAVRRRSAVLRLSIPPLVYLLVVIGSYPKINLRYLLPALPALLAAIVLAARAVVPTCGGARWRPLLLVLVLATSAAVLLPAMAVRAGHRALLLRWAIGTVSADEVRRLHPDPAVRQIVDLEAALQQTEPGARILMLFEARKPSLSRETIADVRASNWPLLSQTRAASNCLAGQGITAILLNKGALLYYLSRGASAEVLRVEALEKFLQRCTSPVFAVGPYLLFRLEPEAAFRGGVSSSP